VHGFSRCLSIDIILSTSITAIRALEKQIKKIDNSIKPIMANYWFIRIVFN